MTELLKKHVIFGLARLPATEKETHLLLEQAYRLGVREFDTAPAYHGSEMTLGRAFSGVEDVRFTTKYGRGGRAEGFPVRNMKAELKAKAKAMVSFLGFTAHSRKDYSAHSQGRFVPSELRASVEDSLRILQRDCLSCLLLHEPRSLSDIEAIRDELDSMMRDGLIRRVGVGTGSSSDRVPPYGDVLQCSVWGVSENLKAPGTMELRLHGFARGLDAIADRTFSQSWRESCHKLGVSLPSPKNKSEKIALLMYGATLLYDAKLVYSTTQIRNLVALSDAAASVERSLLTGADAASAREVLKISCCSVFRLGFNKAN